MGFPPKSDRERLFAVTTVLAFVAMYAFYAYVWQPKNEELAVIQVHIDSLNAQNERVKAELATGSIDDLLAQARRYKQNLEVMRQLVPLGNEVPALLEQVSTAARRTGLDLGDIQPQPVIVGEIFDTYRYKIGIIGSYHDVAVFLTNVGSLTRIIAPVNLSLTPTTNTVALKTRAAKDKAVLNASLDLQTYVARVAPAGAPQGAPTTAAAGTPPAGGGR